MNANTRSTQLVV